MMRQMSIVGHNVDLLVNSSIKYREWKSTVLGWYDMGSYNTAKYLASYTLLIENLVATVKLSIYSQIFLSLPVLTIFLFLHLPSIVLALPNTCSLLSIMSDIS